MIVVASAGLNLPRELIAHGRIEETPHQIVIDGTQHDSRSIPSIATLLEWMQNAKTPPYPLGSSAAEYVGMFNDLVKRTNQVLVVTGTRKLLGTYDAAVAATRIVSGSRKGFEARVLDTGLTELGAGIIAAYCAGAARAGHPLNAIIEAGQILSDASMQLCAPYSLDLLARIGRADLAHELRSSGAGSPIIGMMNGEFRNVGTAAQAEDPVNKLVELVQERYRLGSALWVTVTYADDQTLAQKLLALLRRRFDVRYALLRQLGPVSYLFLGGKAIALSAHPVESMKLMVRLPEAR